MAIEDFKREHRIDGSSDRAFGLVFAVIFGIVALWPWVFGGQVRVWSLLVAAGFGGIALIRPQTLAALNRLWMRFGLLLARVVSPVALGLVYGLTIVPTGLIWRLTGKDTLGLKFDKNAGSYWIRRDPPGPDPKTFRNQF